MALWHHALPVLALLLPLAAAAPAAEPARAWPERVVVGYEELPPGIQVGDVLDGWRVTQVLENLTAVQMAPTRAARTLPAGADVEYVEADPVRSWGIAALPADPLSGTQYHLGLVGAPLAWSATQGDADAAVCIVDTGVRYSHEDIAGARWKGGEDVFYQDGIPWDLNGHGTHVAGIAAATIGNGLGGHGLANVDVYAVRALWSDGRGTVSSIAAGILWCADNAPRNTVINLSLGTGVPYITLQNAVAYAYGKGQLVVAAAGNDGGTSACATSQCVSYPAAFAEAIAVTCVNASRAVCPYSSRGPEAELAAPGHAIQSTCWDHNGAYCAKSGTSMSAPVVSGVAALLWSQEPALTNVQVRERLVASATDLGPRGRDATTGHGLVSAQCALACVRADLAVSLDAMPDVLTGTIASTTARVTNAGPTAVEATLRLTFPGAVPDAMPAGCTKASNVVTCALGTLTVGPERAVTIPWTAPAATTLRVQATVTPSVSDPDRTDNAATATARVATSLSDLSVTVQGPSQQVLVGAALAFNVTVTNLGPHDAAAVTLTDSLPAGLAPGDAEAGQGQCARSGATVTCSLGALAVGESVHVTLPMAASRAGSATNIAVVRLLGGNDPVPVNNRAVTTASVRAPVADLQVAAAGPATTVVAGDTVGFILTVTNAGPDAAPAVTVTHALPRPMTYGEAISSAGSCARSGTTLTCTLGRMAPGANATVAWEGVATGVGALASTVTAAVTGGVDPLPGDNRVALRTHVRAPVADLAILLNAPAGVLAGTSYAYNVTVVNHGPEAAPAVRLVHALPSGVLIGAAVADQGTCTRSGSSLVCLLGALPAGATASVQVPATSAAAGARSLAASVAVTGGGVDPVRGNDRASAAATVRAPVADLAVTVDAPATAQAGAPYTQTFTVTNAGTDDAPGVRLVASVAASSNHGPITASQGSCTRSGTSLSCTLGALAAGATATVTLDSTPVSLGAKATSVTVSVLGGGVDPAPANNRAVAATVAVRA